MIIPPSNILHQKRLPPTRLVGNVTVVLNGQRVRIAVGDREDGGAVVVADGVGSVAGVDGSRVKGAVEAVRDTLLVDDVSVEVVAGGVGAVVLGGGGAGGLELRLGDGPRLGGVGLAGGGADGDVEGDVVVLWGDEEGGEVDGGWKRGWAGEVGNGWGRRWLAVAVGSRDDDLELVAPLPAVGGGGGDDGGAVQRALDVGQGCWVGAAVGGLDGWVALEVDVEAQAARGLVTVGGTGRWVVLLKGVVAHVGVLLGGALKCNEGGGVWEGRYGRESGLVVDGVGKKRSSGVWVAGHWTVASRLSRAGISAALALLNGGRLGSVSCSGSDSNGSGSRDDGRGIVNGGLRGRNGSNRSTQSSRGRGGLNDVQVDGLGVSHGKASKSWEEKRAVHLDERTNGWERANGC